MQIHASLLHVWCLPNPSQSHHIATVGRQATTNRTSYIDLLWGFLALSPTWAPLNSTVGPTPGVEATRQRWSSRCLSRVKHTIQDRLPLERHSKSFAAPRTRHRCWHAQVLIHQVTFKTTDATESSNVGSTLENSSSSYSFIIKINSYEPVPNHSSWQPSPINSKFGHWVQIARSQIPICHSSLETSRDLAFENHPWLQLTTGPRVCQMRWQPQLYARDFRLSLER